MRGARLFAVAVGIVALGTACSADGDADGDTDVSGTVTVLAAASLTGSFEELAAQLAERYPDLDIEFSFGPSSGLVEQLIAGAPADVLATADTRTMDRAVAGDVIAGTPEIFARNALSLVVPADNPGNVQGLADLADDELRIAICEPQVPCGAASAKLLQRAGVTAEPDTLTTDVKEALSLVTLGEVDAALVYVSDATAAGNDVATIAVRESDSVVNDYPVARVADAPNPKGAQLVIGAITGDMGQSILSTAGFLGP